MSDLINKNMFELINKVASYLPVKNTTGMGGFTTGTLDRKRAQEIIDLVEQSQWVNVNERLPKLTADVLVSIDNDGYNFITVLYLGENGWSQYHNVTHWQPLPPAPDTDTKKQRKSLKQAKKCL